MELEDIRRRMMVKKLDVLYIINVIVLISPLELRLSKNPVQSFIVTISLTDRRQASVFPVQNPFQPNPKVLYKYKCE